jgi:hypothetical protein
LKLNKLYSWPESLSTVFTNGTAIVHTEPVQGPPEGFLLVKSAAEHPFQLKQGCDGQPLTGKKAGPRQKATEASR